MFKFQKQFKIRVVYKSGYTHDFWVSEFEYANGNTYTWSTVDSANRPIDFGATEVAAVWQIDHRTRPMWK